MLQRLTNDETNTFDEVNKALNMLIDAHNENDEYNAEVEAYNKSIEKGGK